MLKPLKKKFRQIKKLPSWVYYPPALMVSAAKSFMRLKLVDPTGSMDMAKLPYITVTWHNRLLFFPTAFPKQYRLRTYALVSPSRDGQYVADFISRFGVRTVRGSTNKRAASALLEAIKVLGEGCNLSVTPDGPRGPRHKMSMGPIALSSLTGFPILPVSVNASSYWELPTWDGFQIPKPWARLELRIGAPIQVPKGQDDAALETWRQKAGKALMDISVFGG